MIKTKNEESIHLEILPFLDKGASYVDALIIYAERHGIEIESLGEIIKNSNVLKDRILQEAIDNKTVKSDETISTVDDFV